MRPFEFAAALVLTALGIRSAVYWARRPFESTASVISCSTPRT
jgi:hypothetical protein